MEIGDRSPQRSLEFKNRRGPHIGGHGHTQEQLSDLLDKLSGKKKPKPDRVDVTPGRAPKPTPEGTRDPSGKIKPHKPA